MAKATDVRVTPRRIVRAIERDFAITFDLDAAALRDNTRCESFFGPDHPYVECRDALRPTLDWSRYGSAVWLNMPYSEIPRWLNKVEQQVTLHPELRVVCLLPSSTSARWWHQYIWNRHRARWRAKVARVQFWPKRIDFEPHTTGAKWPSVVVEFRRNE